MVARALSTASTTRIHSIDWSVYCSYIVTLTAIDAQCSPCVAVYMVTGASSLAGWLGGMRRHATHAPLTFVGGHMETGNRRVAGGQTIVQMPYYGVSVFPTIVSLSNLGAPAG
jgi:hypothetical protein